MDEKQWKIIRPDGSEMFEGEKSLAWTKIFNGDGWYWIEKSRCEYLLLKEALPCSLACFDQDGTSKFLLDFFELNKQLPSMPTKNDFEQIARRFFKLQSFQ